MKLREKLAVFALVLLSLAGGCGAEDSCGQYAGVWEATEERGSLGNEGGIYRAKLTLKADSEAEYFVSDTIDVWKSWSCNESEIIATNQDGDLLSAATIVDSETLQIGDLTLKRIDS